MARPLRIEYPGAIYHLTSRGNGRENIFLKDEDRYNFLETLSSAIGRYKWLCHGFCLMDNHYHILIETPEPNLCLGMRHLNGIYTQSFNRRHHRVGHVFQGRYKSIIVEKNAHLLELCRYVVLNPVRAHMVKKAGDWKWSSYNCTAYNIDAFDFLTIDWILGQFSLNKKLAQEKYRRFVADEIADCDSPWEMLKGQIYLGSSDFISSIGSITEEKETIKEIPKIQRQANRIVLADLFSDQDLKNKEIRNKKVWVAHVRYGYKIKEIADYLSLHYTTISKIINQHKK